MAVLSTKPTANPKATLQGKLKGSTMYSALACGTVRYLMNVLMSFGQDESLAALRSNRARTRGGLALDVATGTGKIAQSITRRGGP